MTSAHSKLHKYVHPFFHLIFETHSLLTTYNIKFQFLHIFHPFNLNNLSPFYKQYAKNATKLLLRKVIIGQIHF